MTALGITDLGRLYYKTTRTEDNSVVVISTVNYLRSTKMVSSLSVHWIPLAKISNRKSTNNILDILIESVQDQVFFHQ
ncbi:unnamed protein product [Allacma fusca]|uniref:Uncharacterized protein n=1 Tax=Allacma fusca TaxID=39272 RepID=A0A8J2J8T9_9HEXA|nr:unnamed protein product [Allacma fusca]